MPQLDRVTFVSQIFWCLLTFSSLYFILLKKTLPQIAKVLKLRKKKIDSYEELLESLKNEQFNFVSLKNNYYTSLFTINKEKTAKQIKNFDNSFFDSNIKNNDVFFIIKLFKNIPIFK
jgi:hypothetical protein